MLQPGRRPGRFERKCAPKNRGNRPRKPLETNGGTDELAQGKLIYSASMPPWFPDREIRCTANRLLTGRLLGPTRRSSFLRPDGEFSRHVRKPRSPKSRLRSGFESRGATIGRCWFDGLAGASRAIVIVNIHEIWNPPLHVVADCAIACRSTRASI